MKFKIPLLNALNFAIIFGVITFSLNKVQESASIIFVSSLYLNVLIWAGIGFLIPLIIAFFMDEKSRSHMPTEISIKWLIIPSILLVILIAIFLFSSNDSLVDIDSQFFDENEEINDTSEDDLAYSGICEELKIVELYHEEAESYYHEETWEEIDDYECNSSEDCVIAFPDHNESNLRCFV